MSLILIRRPGHVP